MSPRLSIGQGQSVHARAPRGLSVSSGEKTHSTSFASSGREGQQPPALAGEPGAFSAILWTGLSLPNPW